MKAIIFIVEIIVCFERLMFFADKNKEKFVTIMLIKE